MKSRSLSYNRATGQVEETLVDVTPEQLAADEAAAAEVQAEQVASANELTIGQLLESALASNRATMQGRQQMVATLIAWRTSGAGAGTASLSLAQLSGVVRQLADNQIAQANGEISLLRQANGQIRVLRRKLEATD